MKHVYLINNKPKEDDFAKTFKREAKKSGYSFKQLESLEFSYFYNRKEKSVAVYYKSTTFPLNPTDVFFVRRWAPSEDATALLCLILEMNKINFTDKKINTQHEIRTSKLSQTFQLAYKNCPCPSTWVVHMSQISAVQKKLLSTLQLPVIVKARGGSGTRVWKCDSKSALERKVAELKKEGKDGLLVFQEFIENQGDIRVVVYKNQVIASIERSAAPGEFLNNVSQGGSARAITISAAERRLALAAAKVIGLDLAGVDIVRSPEGPLLFEVNKAPDITSFNEAAGFDIAARIAEATF